MLRLPHPFLIVCVVCSFLLFSFTHCGTTPSTAHLDQYDHLPYQSTFSLDASKEHVYRASVITLQQHGYLVTMSDPLTGLVNGEIQSDDILAEEYKVQETADTSDRTNLVWTIISFILVFGLILWIIGAFDSDDSATSDDRRRYADEEPAFIEHEEMKTITYRYVVTIHTIAVDERTSEVRISTMRMRMENGAVVRSERIENKYLNYLLLDGIHLALGR